MVKVTAPLHSIEARGRLGSLEYNTFRGIRVVRAHKDPPKPVTEAQLAQQAAFKAVTQAWRDIDPTYQNLWNSWADSQTHSDWTGATIRPTGFNCYVKTNIWVYNHGLTLLLIPPDPVVPPAITSIDYTAAEGGCQIDWTTDMGPNDASHQMILRAHGPISPGRQPDFRHAVYIWQTACDMYYCTITADRFHGSGDYGIYMHPVDLASGQAGGWELIRVTV